ncbi:MAG: DUF4199 domain-containing protein [Bacteroidota bacterium]
MTTLDNDYIDPQDVKMMPTALRYGLIGGLVYVLINLMLYVLGLSDVKEASSAAMGIITTLIVYGMLATVLVMAIKFHKEKELGGFIATGRGIAMGVLTMVFMALVVSVWTYVFMAIIDPGIVEDIRALQMEQLEAQNASEEQIQATMPYIEMMTTPGVSAFVNFVVLMIFGLIVSAIAGAVMKEEHPMA